MFSLNDDEQHALKALGSRLETQRLARNETQQVLAARLGVSIPTYRKMVQGDPTVKIGYWIQAVNLLGSLHALDTILRTKLSFFNTRESQELTVDKRRRVRRKR